MNNHKLEQLAEFVIKEGLRLGATDCAVSMYIGDSITTEVRLGEVEKQEGAQESGLTFTGYLGKKSVSVSSTNFRRDALTKLIRQAIEMAKATEEDQFAGLVDKHLLATNIPDLDLFDPALEKLAPEKKIALALAAEKAARLYDPRISNSDGASFSNTSAIVVYANSLGFLGSYQSTSCGLSASVIATDENNVLQSAGWYSGSRFFSTLLSPEEVGIEAAKRTIRQLGARKVETQQVPVIFEPTRASRLLTQFVSAANGDSIYNRSSIFLDKVGELIANPAVQIIDNPLIPQALGSFPFNREGLPAVKRQIVKDGVLQTYLLTGYAARKLGLQPNGGATGNLSITPGNMSFDEIVGTVKSGLLLTGTFGSGFNPVTGTYSVGANGIWIENGELAYPVHEITIAGNMLEMFKSIEAIGNDPITTSPVSSPTLKITSMMVAGK